jgi:selenocysteine-specific elongation factor
VATRDAAERKGAAGLVLGTAGHIDHGKSSLVLALTGVDPDRLPEEKARGITIELGFAELDLGEGARVSLVDVPGHDKLVRTMVAGATGIDLLLLVVAADEGVMPQTREHVAICDLLGIDRCVVALTKTDLVDAEMIELAREDVRELLAGTALRDAPSVPVSARTGEGLDDLRAALRELACASPPRTARTGPPRLPIDRVFAMRGFGPVVTGTLTGGALQIGDGVEIQPSGRQARIRGLQVHGVACERAAPGSRCAANLQGLEIADLARGDVLTHPDAMRSTVSADVELVWLPSAPNGSGGVSIELLTGTAERRAHLAPIGGEALLPGARCFARLHVDDGPVPLLPGDRFIARGFVRGPGAGATLGGGVVLDVAPPHRRRSDPALARELRVLARRDLRDDLRERVRRSGFAGVGFERLRKETGADETSVRAMLESLAAAGEIAAAGARTFVDASAVERLQERLEAALESLHAAEPLRPGMPRGALRGQLPGNVPGEVGELVIARLEAAARIDVLGDLVRRAGHAPTLDAEARAATERILAQAREAGLDPPSPRDWAVRLGVSVDRLRDLLAHLERSGDLVRAPGDLWFDRRAVEALRGRVVAHLVAHGRIDPAAYKALTGTTRRTTVPLMELLDELHVTRRQGDVRVLRRG